MMSVIHRPEDETSFRLDLPFTAIVGMGIIGTLALIATYIENSFSRGLPQWSEVPIYAFFAFCVGCFVGIVSMPIVLPGLWEKQLGPVLTRVYLPNAAIVMAWQFITEFYEVAYFSCALVAFIGVCGASILFRHRLPDLQPPPTGLCPSCKYDLRGELGKGCPECGWNRAPEA